MTEGEVPNIPETTDMAAYEPQQDPFDQIAKRDGITAKLACRCSYDVSTEEGQGFLARANVSSAGEESKLPYYGKSFMMVAWTAIVRVQRKDKKTGELLPEARPLIRTVIECDDGTEIAFASSYIFSDLQAIRKPSVAEPVECILYKGGAADRIKDVKASAKRVVATYPMKSKPNAKQA